jgi:co-chaperonin GroES (HSP10)
METSTTDKLPTPTGWRLLVLPYKRKEKTKGGIILTDQSLEESQIASSIGLVLKVGPDAYKDKERFPNGPWCKEKEWVIFGKYAGSRIRIEGGEVRLMNDDEILGVIDDPEDFLQS